MSRRRCLVLFVKLPEAGLVKTRLGLPPEDAAALYRRFVEDSVCAFEGGEYSFMIAFHPPSAGEKIREWLRARTVFPQEAADLGGRLRRAFERVFEEGFDEAVIVGSDIPDLPPSIIERAFAQLSGCDSVIGPSPDGGYYLIGFRRRAFLAGAFEGIEWSSEKVFESTVSKLKRAGRTVCVLPEWRDIDSPEDLEDLVSRNRIGPFSASKTMRWIEENGYVR